MLLSVDLPHAFRRNGTCTIQICSVTTTKLHIFMDIFLEIMPEIEDLWRALKKQFCPFTSGDVVRPLWSRYFVLTNQSSLAVHNTESSLFYTFPISLYTNYRILRLMMDTAQHNRYSLKSVSAKRLLHENPQRVMDDGKKYRGKAILFFIFSLITGI